MSTTSRTAGEPMPTHAMAYNSIATKSFSPTELSELANFAAANNGSIQVGGFLCYEDGNFFQYLEGSEEVLHRLMALIRSDPRHRITYEIALGTVDKVNFPGWSMRYLDREDIEKRRLEDSVLDVLLHMMSPGVVRVDPISGVLDCIVEMRKQQAISELKTSNEELSRFAFLAAHDIAAPLTQMSGFADLLREEYADSLDENGRQYVDYIHAAANRLSGMVEELLNYARLETMDKSPQDVDMHSLAMSIADDFQAELLTLNATLEVDRLPVIRAEPGAVRQLLSNLIGNALKYRSLEAPHVRVYAQQENEECVVCVQDNGIGIADQYLGDVFTMFKRCTADSNYSGSGIGLAICERVVANFGGRIWVESVFTQGSTFKFSVPG